MSGADGEDHSCTLAGLADWMMLNQNVKTITDFKISDEKNYLGTLRRIYAALPNAENRIIPQIYSPDQYQVVNEMGFKSVIWTLYSYNGSDVNLLDWVKKIQIPVAVTMPKNRAKSSLPKALKEINVPSFVHTVNNPISWFIYLGFNT